jgi:hypothetical protein
MTRRARLWITGATTSDHSRAQHLAPVPACRPSHPAPGRRHEPQRPSRHGEDGIAFLDVLAAQLRARGWSAYITTPAGRLVSLFVQDPHDHPKCGDIIAALDGATGHWWYWFSWAERIAPAHAPAAAADTIIRALQRAADEPEPPGPAARKASRQGQPAGRRAPSLDRPSDLGGSDPWRGWEPCQHSGSTPRSCASAR